MILIELKKIKEMKTIPTIEGERNHQEWHCGGKEIKQLTAMFWFIRSTLDTRKLALELDINKHLN